MDLAHQEEMIMGCKDNNMIIKGKRTKRQRLSSPLALTMASTSSSGEVVSDGGHFSDNSAEFASSTEEEDMANCLILLAQGDAIHQKQTRAATSGLYVYQCKTCDRCFPSFQALGGHRASHKKESRVAVADEKRPATVASSSKLVIDDHDNEENVFKNTTTTLSLQIMSPPKLTCSANKANKCHECSICGVGFTSGQALGGHMRRHRSSSSGSPNPTAMTGLGCSSSMVSDSHQTNKKPRTTFSLDLNLPAPASEDDHRESKFSFVTGKEQTLVFSASALVDCHY
ncbi:hypothetical protein RJ641_024988 [Dillenia turbinata]|uniref:C2H2-type domain-containing protein n=1 Tax=Dillenia turbinata TaxID=194707 RepID=A0AAN8W9L0_9MAGN